MEEVQIGFLRAHGQRVVSAKDLAELRQHIEKVLIPMAQAAGVIDAGLNFDDLAALYTPDDPSFGTNDSSPAQFIARDDLITATGWVVLADIVRNEWNSQEADAGDDKEELDWRLVASSASSLTTHIFGYLSALLDSRRDTVRRGANGRKLIGATTRERVRKAALEHRGKSKDGAAEEISKIVNKSAGHVRRMLTKMYPGDSWSKREGDTSTDATGQIGG